MRHVYGAPVAALLGLALVVGTAPAPASAQVARPQAGNVMLGANVNSGDATATEVRYRHRRHGHWHHRRHRDRGWGWGAAGLATGLIVGSAIANSQARADSAVEYCMRRFRSYDPRSGTYMGYDGVRHPCP